MPKLNDYGDVLERPIRRTGSLWAPLFALLHVVCGNSVRPIAERSSEWGWTVVDYAVLGR